MQEHLWKHRVKVREHSATSCECAGIFKKLLCTNILNHSVRVYEHIKEQVSVHKHYHYKVSVHKHNDLRVCVYKHSIYKVKVQKLFKLYVKYGNIDF